MLIFQFLLVNANFVICLGVGLVMFAIFWLYFDAWLVKKGWLESFNFLGFLLLSISFIFQSAIIDQSLLSHSSFGGDMLELLRSITRISGYLLLIITQIFIPLEPLPDYRKKKALLFLPVVFSYPLLAALTGLLYLRRATTGLEDHLKPIAWAFFMLAFSELFNFMTFFRSSDNILISNLSAAFSPLWIFQKLILLVTVFIFGRWAWSYLLKRFDSQLFIIFTSSILTIFLVTTIFFTFSTLNNIKSDLLSTLKTDVGVLGYTIESKKNEVMSDAETLAQNPELIANTEVADRKALADITVPILINKKASELVIVGKNGEIILRSEDTDNKGGSLSDDPLVKKALAGEKASSLITREGVIAPVVSVRAAVPIKSDKTTVGVILMGSDIDNSYVDGIKKATGLNASIYADDVRSATTFIAGDGKSRYLGIKESNPQVKKQVLDKGEIYVGSTKILNIPYFSAFAPLISADNIPIGMLFVGTPEVSILKTAGRSIELTFITTILLLVISVIPSYLISKYIERQIR
ncbi:MAG: Methyl-accepting chemotaxis protein [Candidatus Roizmanbacteria bacterium GW2011_GWA2_35_19]|uniref:Methyl-accepting chemotaxis protein n=2 Tax=Candidatus Roizmaniibacteriota TaxID=1752723 RepID=A0A0G0EYF2_9BACT|nr:MAG: Methyl-accepting chemotaxis protein [Candidatus Roizmanbacteria bacterium GW2011_GWC2_35_12]KKP72152.1 MAG: Methyl-accepting chemotaxis protein [Candidatus Roizmanbacteria bacterium GW2011_GWA2_35_19]